MKKQIVLVLALMFLMSFAVVAQRGGREKITVSASLIQLEQLSGQLNYMSETDSVVSNYLAPLQANILTQEEFLRVSMLSPDTEITQVADVDTWFANQARFDTNGRWLALQTYMNSKFSNVVVYRVGTVQVLYYAVGLYKGRIIGVRAVAVET